MFGRDTPPAPLERGDWNAIFLFENECFTMWSFPLERGVLDAVSFLVIKGLSMMFPLLRGD